MIRITTANHYRAAAAFVAAAVLSFNLHHASAQQTVDLFAGAIDTPSALSVDGTLALPASTSGPFGPGFDGSISLSAGALNTFSEGFTELADGTNVFSIAQTGVLTVAGSTSASKIYTGTSLTPGGTYQLTLTSASGFTVGLLGSLNVSLASGNTSVLDTSNGTGLAGVVDLLGLFGGGNTATLQFTVPASAAGDLSVNIASTETVGVLGGTDTFQSATITQVPEPRTVATMLTGAAGLMLLRFRRRLRMA